MVKMNPKISVIVPVYNGENYISRCIESILLQTFTDFELLLIDDGSKDNSGNICDKYALKDKRIKVFHKKNGGVSSARNLGLYHAKGEWVSFIDADDYIEQNYFPVDLLADESWDIIQIPRSGGSNFHDYNKDIICANRYEVINFLHKNFYYECWGRFIKRKKLSEKLFDETVKIGEDLLFFVSIYNRISTYYVKSTGGRYIYSINNASTMSRNSDPKSIEISTNLIIDKLWSIIYAEKNTLAIILLISSFLNRIYKRHELMKLYHTIGFNSLMHLPSVSLCRKTKFIVLLVLSFLKN